MEDIANLNRFLGIMQATVAPAMIISGLAIILTLMAGRYARCIDRTRAILDILNFQADKISQEKRKAYVYQLRIIYKRCRQLRTMMACASVSVFLVVLTISCVFMSLLFKLHVEKLASTLFLVALALLCLSMGQFIRDIIISLYGIKVEIKDFEGESFH
jgi:hypothetical protein